MSAFPGRYWTETREKWVLYLGKSSFEKSLVNDKMDYVFKGPQYAPTKTREDAFILKNVAKRASRYFYVDLNNTVINRSQFVYGKDDLDNL